MFLLVNTFHRIPGNTAGHIVSRHRSVRKAFERQRLESRKAIGRGYGGTLGTWLVVVDLGDDPCPQGFWAPANTGTIVEWEDQ